jgi:ABC-2 type transport system permease protein
VFVTTHFLEEVEYCDWACFIDAGRLIANAHPAEIRRRFSDGYRVRIGWSGAAYAAVVDRLAATGAEVMLTDGALVVRTPTLSPPILDAVAHVARAHGDAPIAIERPEMSDVFRRLMMAAQERQVNASAARAAPLVAEQASTTSAPPRPQIRLTETSNVLRARARRLRALLVRESRATLRDPFTVTILIAVPLAALLAFGLTLSTEVRDLALGLLDANGTAASRRLVAELAANGTFAIRPYATREEIDRALVSGDISVAVVVPPDFDRRLAAGRPGDEAPSLHVLYDGGETVVAGNAEGFLRGLANATGTALRTRRGPPPEAAGREGGGVRVVARALFNPTLDGTPFMVAGTYGFVLTFLTTLITAVSVVNERVGGTFEQLQVTPASASEIVLGKILPLGAVFTADVVLMVLTAGLVLGVWPAGNAAFFVLATAGYVLVSLSTGVILSATSGTPAEAVQKTVLFSIPLIFLGGFIFPIRNMPIGFQWLAEAIPATHYIRIARAIYLRAAGPLELAAELALVALFGAALMTIAFRAVGARA